MTDPLLNRFQTLFTRASFVLFLLMTAGAVDAQPVKNGFDLGNSLVPPEEIRSGGPPKDGIPALTNPSMISPGEASYLDASDQVIGVDIDGEARAYPLKILVHHENVNDVVGGQPVAVTYWPLCNSSLVVDRRIGGEVREFGISGLLYNSNVLLYDRQDSPAQESLWSQIERRAVAGPAADKGLKLDLLPFEQTSWSNWKEKHPDTRVLSTNTGYPRSYERNPYANYFGSQRVMFNVDRKYPDQPDLKNKDMLMVVHLNGTFKGYPSRRVTSAAGSDGMITDSVAGRKVQVRVDADGNLTAHYPNGSGQPPVFYTFWFAFQTEFEENEASLFDPGQ